jgi:ATP synthase protein I
VKAGFSWLFGLWETVLTAPDPQRLTDLGKRLDEAQKRQAAGAKRPPPSQAGIAGRFATELVAALVVGGGLGWGIDWLFGHFGFHTRPVFLMVFFILGAAAGIRNVMRAATEINAEIAAKSAAAKGDEET